MMFVSPSEWRRAWERWKHRRGDVSITVVNTPGQPPDALVALDALVASARLGITARELAEALRRFGVTAHEAAEALRRLRLQQHEEMMAEHAAVTLICDCSPETLAREWCVCGARPAREQMLLKRMKEMPDE